jgi:hypothetical protein
MKRQSRTFFAAPPGPTPAEMSQRFPSTPPEHISLPVGKWLLRSEAVAALQAGNGTDDPVVASCWLVAMVRKESRRYQRWRWLRPAAARQ